MSIFYFSLRSASLAIRRVRMRVQLGGHDVPAEVVSRRFGRSLANFFNLYVPQADEWSVFDNSAGSRGILVAAGNAAGINVEQERTWQKLQRLARSSSGR